MGLTFKNGKIKSNYQNAIDTIRSAVIRGDKELKIYYNNWKSNYGSFKHMKLVSVYWDFVDVCNEYNIKIIERGNDGKRGGAEHEYITIKLDGRNTFIKSLKENKK